MCLTIYLIPNIKNKNSRTLQIYAPNIFVCLKPPPTPNNSFGGGDVSIVCIF